MTINEQQDRGLFDRIAARYVRKDILPASAVARRTQLLFALGPALERLGPDAVIIDVGCGIGAAALYLKGRYRRYIGIDHSQEMVRAARAFHCDNPQVEFFADSIYDLPMPSVLAELVMTDGSLHHMADPEKAVAAMTRLGKNDAYIVVREPVNHNPLFQFARWTRRLLDREYSRQQAFFSEKELATAFAQNSISDTEVDFFGFLSTPFAQVRLPLQILAAPLSRICANLDLFLSRHLPRCLRRYAWNIVVRGKIRK